ncbi:MAG: T9SS type A sorting domain-containing protein, partial [Bacteroidetes bacterium]|nr:T9SS type A sorting domain-containing protein [Bacteroidota bacterium]
LNGNDLGQSYTVPAGGCLQDIVVNVSMLNASSPLEYPNLELFLYADCEEDIQSSVFASVFFGSATSIEEDLQTIDQVVLFPNPASQTATLTFDLLQAGTVGVEIYDLAGRRWMRQDASLRQAGPQRWEFPVHSLAEGIYIVHILSNQGAYAPQKLVVRR